MIEMTFSGLRTCQVDHQPVMLLRQKGGHAYLPIIIGPYEAQAISLGWQKVLTPRPMSHDLMRDLLTHLGARLTSVYINDFRDGIFYARLVIDANGRHAEVDSRPSDAVALAVRLKVPILVEEWIVQNAGFTSEEPDGDRAPGKTGEQGRDDKEDLGIFRDFINSLDLDDLDSRT